MPQAMRRFWPMSTSGTPGHARPGDVEPVAAGGGSG